MSRSAVPRTCAGAGCDRPRTRGRGNRYCAECRAEAAERDRRAAVERTRRWRDENPEKYRAQKRGYYERTAAEQRAWVRAWEIANPDRVRARRAAQQAKKLPRVGKYGMTAEDYFALLEAQGGCCAICGRTENGKRHNFDVDHDHTTGAVRGLLCNRCNRLLSNATDDIGTLERAAEYLAASIEIRKAA